VLRILDSSEHFESILQIGHFMGDLAVDDPIHAKVLDEDFTDMLENIFKSNHSLAVGGSDQKEGAEAAHTPDVLLGAGNEGDKLLASQTLLLENILEIGDSNRRGRERNDGLSIVDGHVFCIACFAGVGAFWGSQSLLARLALGLG